MGTYIYHLTTKSRRVKVGDTRENVYLLSFAGKDTSRVDRYTRLRDARVSHLESAWCGRDFPKYVVHGEFEDGAIVFTDWPSVSSGDKGYKPFPSIVVIENPKHATFAGYLRRDGARYTLEKWHRVAATYPTHEEYWAALTAVRGLMGGKPLYSQMTEDFVKGGRVFILNIYCKDENDTAIIKLAM